MNTASEGPVRSRARGPLARLAAVLAVLGALTVPASAQLAAPASAGTALGASSVTWNWTLSAGATGYRVLSSTAGDISGPLDASVSSFTVLGLSTNTAYTATIEAAGPGGPAFSAPDTVYTAAATPSGTMLVAQDRNVETLSWLANGNPAGTTYRVHWNDGSNDVVFSTQPAVVAGSATATVQDLPGGRTIVLTLDAVNGDGVAAGVDVAVTTATPVLYGQSVVSSATFALGTSSITWYWSASTGAFAYQLFNATNGAVSPLLGASAVSYVQTGLTPDASSTLSVEAFSVGASTRSAPFTRYTLAANTTGLTLASLDTSANGTAHLTWGAGGNGPATVYEMKWWTSVTSTVTVATGTTHGVLSNLPAGGTIYFTVRTRNGDGIPGPYDSSLFATVPSTSFAVSSQTIPAGFSGMMFFVTPTAEVALTIASGTFAVPATVSVTSPTTTLPATGPDQSPISPEISYEIKVFDPFGAPLQPLKPVAMLVSYVGGGLGALDPGRATVARYDAAHGGWLPLLTLRSGRGLLATTDHLSQFMVLGVAAPGDFSAITVGPNPLRPTVVPGDVMTFRGLPAGARVRIFTYLGEKIADLTVDPSGLAAWDGRNASGMQVASGVYLALVQGGGKKKILRVAVER